MCKSTISCTRTQAHIFVCGTRSHIYSQPPTSKQISTAEINTGKTSRETLKDASPEWRSTRALCLFSFVLHGSTSVYVCVYVCVHVYICMCVRVDSLILFALSSHRHSGRSHSAAVSVHSSASHVLLISRMHMYMSFVAKVYIIHLCMSLRVCMYARMCVCVCMCACMHACMYVCIYVVMVCMYVCMYVCVYVCML